MFEKTLTDVVKGIRASKRDTGLYISQCIAEIKTEIASADMYVKANALQKLTFLQMMGYSMNWASFATIEVMSSAKFAHKRVGYLAASQGFTPETDVILLTTNLLKKELRGATGNGGASMHGVYEAGLAINCISNIVTEDLARDLLPELTDLTSHPQPYLRKKAILCLFKVFVKYPQGLRLTFAKLQACLDDSNSAVVSCAVNVITELSDKNPKNYLPLAPAFFQLVTSSSNNWMLIKVVKLLGSLVQEEPRLARKLLEPLANIVRRTQAKSLLYEACYTITLCLPYCRKNDGTMPAIVPDIVTLCAQTLRSFVEEPDQNLKYLGLVGFGSLMQSHPRVLSAPDYRPLILACLSDQDVTIRTRALDLLTGMASRKNLPELVSQLLQHVELASGTYKHDLVRKIVIMCSSEKYALLSDFGWYLDILFRLGHMRGVEKHAQLLHAQIVDVALRVLPIRAFAVKRSMEILLEGEGSVSDDLYGDNGRGKHLMPEILPGIAWIVGEYSNLIPEAGKDDDDDEDMEFFYDEDSKGTYHAVIQALTTTTNVSNLPTVTQKVYIQAAMKVLAAATSNKDVGDAELEACIGAMDRALPVYTQSVDVEVIERAFTSLELLRSLDLITDTSKGSIPRLASVEDDTDDEAVEGDLLGMLSGTTNSAAVVPTFVNATNATVAMSLASKARQASMTLNYLLKPKPMKPSGAKVQRKKRHAPIGVTVDIDTPVNLSIFQKLIDGESKYRSTSNLRVESVSFTQQRPAKVEESKHYHPDTRPPGSLSASQDASTSFQNQRNAVGVPINSKSRESDPFYLDSAPQSGTEGERDSSGRFGTIQLLDSDDDAANEGKVRKKKVKKSKRAKSKVTVDGSLTSFGEQQSSFLEPVVNIYESDDSEKGKATLAPRINFKSREFEGLAMVDLTTPLRDDEVMPERKHHIVANYSVDNLAAVAPKSKKKSKKSTKLSKKRSIRSENTVGDLLDLGGMESMPVSQNSNSFTPVAPVPDPSSAINPINSAFDDLMGFSDPTPALHMTSFLTSSLQSHHVEETSSSLPASRKTGKQPWMLGMLKASGSVGFTGIDISMISLTYRLYQNSSPSGLASKAVLRLTNSSGSPIDNLVLELNDGSSFPIGSAAPRSHTESSKVGPFMYSAIDQSLEVRGSLKCSLGSLRMKLLLPAALHLVAEQGISFDQLTQELLSSQWSTHSTKLPLSNRTNPIRIMKVITHFFHAAQVTGSASTPATETLAARSTKGAKVRILVKIKENFVKLDIKSTDDALARHLCADVKHCVL
jgi:AP-3 complex subunit delta-1